MKEFPLGKLFSPRRVDPIEHIGINKNDRVPCTESNHCPEINTLHHKKMDLLPAVPSDQRLHLCDTQKGLNAYANSKGSVQPAHLRRLVRAFAVRAYNIWTLRILQAQVKTLARLHELTDWFESSLHADT